MTTSMSLFDLSKYLNGGARLKHRPSLYRIHKTLMISLTGVTGLGKTLRITSPVAKLEFSVSISTSSPISINANKRDCPFGVL